MYFAFIDVLRFLASFSVMNTHYFGEHFSHSDKWFSYFFRYGFLGVELFFMISGFVIYFSLKKGLKEYLLGRFVRLFPLFWFCCTVVYFLSYVFPNGDPLPFAVYLKNLLMINSGQISDLVDSVYWTLTIEIVFYIGIALFVSFFSLKRIEYFFLLWLIVSFFIFHFHFESALFSKMLLVRYSPYFAFGGVLGLLYESWKNDALFVIIRRVLLLVFSASLAFYFSYLFNIRPTSTTNNFGILDTNSTIIVLSFFILVPLAVFFSSFTLKWKKFVVVSHILGGITYPLYLIHQKLGLMIVGLFDDAKRVLILIIIMLNMIVLSYFLYIVDEVFRKKLYKKLLHYFSARIS